MRSGLAVLTLFGAAAVSPARAQSPALTVILQSGIPRIQTTALLADGQFVGLMRSGFPLRLHYRLELWRSRSGWFDQFVTDFPWDAVARHDPLADDFVLIRSESRRVARYGTADDLERALELPYHVLSLTPKGRGRFYYVCRLEVSTLNDTDLEELTRWLKGDAGPAVSGGGDVGGALSRGAQRLLVRMAGLPHLTLEARSETLTQSASSAASTSPP
ncbi:MAG: hypothetical protein DMD44_07070 [Gemmatimonadetes bacterium]|nr:MAG: hypothetical protein DMD44_07070 [Gemmatimonadota bacterium]